MTYTMLPIRVSCRSQAVACLLHPQQVVIGWVHSCYARIINVLTPTGRFLTLQGEGGYRRLSHSLWPPTLRHWGHICLSARSWCKISALLRNTQRRSAYIAQTFPCGMGICRCVQV